MKEIILIKCGEIALKGLNKSTFEDILIRNMRRRLKALGQFEITRAQSTIYILPLDDSIDIDEATERLKKVFGIAAICRAGIVKKDIEDIKAQCITYFADILPYTATFKVEAKRADKSFPMISPAICRDVGEALLNAYHNLKVDVNSPDVIINVEIREHSAYIHAGKISGAGGLPIGCGGRAALLISGGIDSPVAGYMMSKRGLELTAIHFVSPPYTSDRARLKVEELLQKMSEYCGRMNFLVVPFTEIQENIKDRCDNEYFTIIMRRFMMRIALRLARGDNCDAIITGESLGQVASQTISAIACTDCICDMPVFRPLIGMDKSEIVEIAQKIDTFETSIQPYEDCCTVFTPRHPRTKPRLADVLCEEAKAEWDEMVDRAVANTERLFIGG